MAQTLHRTESRSGALSVKRLLSDIFDAPNANLKALATFGQLGYTLAMLAEYKVKVSARDKEGKKVNSQIADLRAEIDKAIAPTLKAMSEALPKGHSMSEAMHDAIAQTICPGKLAQIADCERQLDALSVQYKDVAVSQAIEVLMGKANGKADFPASGTTYVVVNNANRWSKVAFCFESGEVPVSILKQNGDGWEEVDVDLSGEYAYRMFTSNKALQQVHFTINTMPERLATWVEMVDDNYNPFSAIRTKSRSEVEDYPLDDWMKANL